MYKVTWNRDGCEATFDEAEYPYIEDAVAVYSDKVAWKMQLTNKRGWQPSLVVLYLIQDDGLLRTVAITSVGFSQ